MATAPDRVEPVCSIGSQTDVDTLHGFAAHLGPAFAAALVERCDLLVVHLGPAWEIFSVNDTLKRCVQNRSDLSGQCFLELVDSSSVAALKRMAAAGKLDRGAVTVQHPVAAGERTVEYSFQAVEDGWIGVGRDRTEEFELVSQMSALVEDLETAFGAERALARQLRVLAERDALTGLFNRRQLEEMLRDRVRDYIDIGTPFAVICLDLDHFKLVNDTHGHTVGDQALRCVASEIQGILRESDTAARYGGEEFVVIVTGAGAEQSAAIGERLRAAVENAALPASLDGLTVSVGVACTVPDDRDRATRLFDLADTALYRAKAEGRNRVCVAG